MYSAREDKLNEKQLKYVKRSMEDNYAKLSIVKTLKYAKLSIVKTLKYVKLSMEENYAKFSIVKTLKYAKFSIVKTLKTFNERKLCRTFNCAKLSIKENAAEIYPSTCWWPSLS